MNVSSAAVVISTLRLKILRDFDIACLRFIIIGLNAVGLTIKILSIRIDTFEQAVQTQINSLVRVYIL